MAFRLRHGLSLLIWALLGASVLLAQSRRADDLGVGKLFVVPRQSPDPNFAESVVLLVHYGEDGTVGLMINRQTKLLVSRVLRDLEGSSNSSQPVYAGGPVQMEAVQVLLQSGAGPHDATRVFGNVYLVSKRAELERRCWRKGFRGTPHLPGILRVEHRAIRKRSEPRRLVHLR